MASHWNSLKDIYPVTRNQIIERVHTHLIRETFISLGKSSQNKELQQRIPKSPGTSILRNLNPRVLIHVSDPAADVVWRLAPPVSTRTSASASRLTCHHQQQPPDTPGSILGARELFLPSAPSNNPSIKPPPNPSVWRGILRLLDGTRAEQTSGIEGEGASRSPFLECVCVCVCVRGDAASPRAPRTRCESD